MILNNEFEKTLSQLSEEAKALQKTELELQQKQILFTQKLQGFLKESGLPENFTLPELALLCIRKARA